MWCVLENIVDSIKLLNMAEAAKRLENSLRLGGFLHASTRAQSSVDADNADC